MINLNLTVDEGFVREIQDRLEGIENKAPRVIANALNRTMMNLATNINKDLRAKYHIKSTDIRETLIKKRANANDLTASVKSKGGVIGLDHFKVMPKKVVPKRKIPIKTAVKKSGVKQLPGAFVAETNGLKVFIRDTQKRFPIRRLYGPSIPQMLKNEGISNELNEKALEMFSQRIEHEISRLMDGGNQ